MLLRSYHYKICMLPASFTVCLDILNSMTHNNRFHVIVEKGKEVFFLVIQFFIKASNGVWNFNPMPAPPLFSSRRMNLFVCSPNRKGCTFPLCPTLSSHSLVYLTFIPQKISPTWKSNEHVSYIKHKMDTENVWEKESTQENRRVSSSNIFNQCLLLKNCYKVRNNRN